MPRATHIVILLVCGTIVAASFILDVDDGGVYIFGWRWPLKCSMRERFGVNCATCGLTRAFCYAAHGDIARAFEMNPVWPAVATAVLLEIVYRLAALAVWPRKLGTKLVTGHAWVMVGVALLLIGHWFLYLGGLLL